MYFHDKKTAYESIGLTEKEWDVIFDGWKPMIDKMNKAQKYSEQVEIFETFFKDKPVLQAAMFFSFVFSQMKNRMAVQELGKLLGKSEGIEGLLEGLKERLSGEGFSFGSEPTLTKLCEGCQIAEDCSLKGHKEAAKCAKNMKEADA